MDEKSAEELLTAERRRVENSLRDAQEAFDEDRSSEDDAAQSGDIADPAERLTAEGLDSALAVNLRDRLAAIERAEKRLREGTYGRSVRSGAPIPDERLESDPAAELTVEEAAENSEE